MTRSTATKLPKPKADDIAYAYECAAEFLEAEEWPEEDGGAQVAAYREVAKRLRRGAIRAASAGSPVNVPNTVGYDVSRPAPVL